MGDGDTRANDASYELDGRDFVGEARPAAGEVARMHRLAQELRNPVGSLSMAVEMVLGPLRHAIEALSQEDARRVQGTLEAMSESSRQLRQLVSDLSALASSTHEQTFEPHEPVPCATVSRGDPLQSQADGPAPRPRSSTLDVGDILRRLEILTVTRSAVPALLATDFEADLYVEGNGPEVLRALSSLVENGVRAAADFEPGAGPWTVDVRAYQREGRVHIEIHNRGAALPEVVGEWLSAADKREVPALDAEDKKSGLSFVARVAESMRGTLAGRSAADMTIMTLAFPAAPPPSLGADEGAEGDRSRRSARA